MFCGTNCAGISTNSSPNIYSDVCPCGSKCSGNCGGNCVIYCKNGCQGCTGTCEGYCNIGCSKSADKEAFQNLKLNTLITSNDVYWLRRLLIEEIQRRSTVADISEYQYRDIFKLDYTEDTADIDYLVNMIESPVENDIVLFRQETIRESDILRRYICKQNLTSNTLVWEKLTDTEFLNKLSLKLLYKTASMLYNNITGAGYNTTISTQYSKAFKSVMRDYVEKAR